MSQEKVATADQRELAVLNDMLKLADTSNRIIAAVQADNNSAAELSSELVTLAKSAGYVDSTADENELRTMLESKTGAMKVACQILREVVALPKRASAAGSPPAGFAVVTRGTGQPMTKKASADGDDEDVIGKDAARYL